jgi:hypothetical protein
VSKGAKKIVKKRMYTVVGRTPEGRGKNLIDSADLEIYKRRAEEEVEGEMEK